MLRAAAGLRGRQERARNCTQPSEHFLWRKAGVRRGGGAEGGFLPKLFDYLVFNKYTTNIRKKRRRQMSSKSLPLSCPRRREIKGVISRTYELFLRCVINDKVGEEIRWITLKEMHRQLVRLILMCLTVARCYCLHNPLLLNQYSERVCLRASLSRIIFF